MPTGLRAQGRLLDPSPEALGSLRDSTPIRDVAAALRTRMEEDGYLFLPGLLDRSDVIAARRECARRIAEAGMLAPGSDPVDLRPRAGMDRYFSPELTEGNAALMRILYDGPMMAFFTAFLGGEVRHFDYTWLRTVGPGAGTAPHMDIVYMGRGTTRLYTAWTPLGDIPIDVGGLMILEGSHRQERVRRAYGTKDVDEWCTNKRPEGWTGMGGGGNIARNGVLHPDPVRLRERLGGRWLTSDFRMGDLLVFGMFTAHASLDNGGDTIRLSSDSRYQLASEPVDERWIGEHPVGHGPAGKRGKIC